MYRWTEAEFLRGSSRDTCTEKDIWSCRLLQEHRTGWADTGRYDGVFSQRKEPTGRQ